MQYTVKTSTTEASGHWYDRSGVQIATVLDSKGKQVKPTLRHARKQDWVPGVTTIIKEHHKEMLVQYRERQTLMAALTLPRLPGESDADYISRVQSDAREAAWRAAEQGSAIHGVIENGLRQPDCADMWVIAVRQQLAIIHSTMSDWRCEMPCVHPHGYGTKSDLSLDVDVGGLQNLQWVVDIKTKDGNLENINEIYDEHAQQLAATAHALCMPKAMGAILFVSRTEPKAKMVIATADQLKHGWDVFRACLNLWQTRNRYAPTWATSVY